MNFGLLCDDPAAGWLMSVLRNHPAHALTRAVLVSPGADELLHGFTGVTCSDRWEDLLATAEVDAVIVGGTAPEIWDGARQLASAGTPLLVFPRTTCGPAILYELSLIRDDQQGVLFPCWPHRHDPDIVRLKHGLQAEDRPAITYLHWDRVVGLGPGREIPKAVIEDELLPAADLLHFLFGTTDQVTALRTGGTATGALLQSVNLSGRAFPECTWAIQSAEAGSSRLTLQTDRGPWFLDWDASQSRWRLTDNAASPPKPAEGVGGTDLLSEFAAAVARGSGASNWTSVLHAAEVVDAAQRSLERRRTIDLHHETLSERAIFKTQMAAMGCGVLLLTLLLMLGYLAVAGMAPLDDRLLRLFRLLVFAPLFVFLLLQLLLPLTRTGHQAAASPPGPASPHN